MRFVDKIAVVTGAGSGIGAELSRTLIKRGARVVLAGRHEDRLHAVIDSTVDASRAHAVRTDVAQLVDLEHLVAVALELHGRIDILVNNAGILLGGALTDLTPEEVQGLVTVNLIGPMWLTQLVLPALLERDEALIVNISSLSGQAPVPFQAPYAGSKFGLRGFSVGLRRDLLGTRVRVMTVYPGGVDTGMTKQVFDRGNELGMMKGHGMSPAAAAARIVAGMQRGRAELFVCGGLERALALGDHWARSLVDLAFKRSAGSIRDMLMAGNSYARAQLSPVKRAEDPE